MARIRFTADFDYKPVPSVTIGYKAGSEHVVKRDCANQAIDAGKAVDVYRGKGSSDGKGKIGG